MAHFEITYGESRLVWWGHNEIGFVLRAFLQIPRCDTVDLCSREARPFDSCLDEYGSFEVCAAEICPREVCAVEIRPMEVCTAEVCIAKVSLVA